MQEKNENKTGKTGSLNAKLKAARNQLGMSQQEVAEAIGLGQSAIAKKETTAKLQELQLLSFYVAKGLSPAFFFGTEDSPEKRDTEKPGTE